MTVSHSRATLPTIGATPHAVRTMASAALDGSMTQHPPAHPPPPYNAAHPEPTQEQIELAWRQMRRPASWPGTLQAALRDRTRAICIKGYARSLARSLGRPAFNSYAAARHSRPSGPVPPTPTEPPVRRTKPPPFDARKAAANDFD